MRVVTVKLPEVYVEVLDELIKLGRYGSRSEAIREALREFFRRELKLRLNRRDLHEEVKRVKIA